MKKIVFLIIGVGALFITAGCEEEHEHHGHYGGAYDGNYYNHGQAQWPGYPARQGYWDRSDDWHPH